MRGSASEKLIQAGHDKLSTYGIGKDKSANYWKLLAWQLIHKEYCFQDLAQYNVLKLHSKAIPLLKGEERIFLTIPNNDLSGGKKKTKERKTYKTSNDPLFEVLRVLRRKLADEENKPPFMIFSDATLHEMTLIKPKTSEELLTVSGVGQHKLTYYGHHFLATIREHLDS